MTCAGAHALAASTSVPNARAAVASTTGISLSAGTPAFWKGTEKQAAATTPLPACSTTQSSCYDYVLAVGGGGARLRVGFDSPGNTSADVALLPGLTGAAISEVNGISLEIFDSQGKSLSSSSGPYSAEVYIAKPAAGTYYVRSTGAPANVTRLRALLEKALPTTKSAHNTLLLPNLQLIPPFEFTFASPTGPVIEGKDPASCNPYEQEEYGGRRCLRFSIGPQNVGAGPLMLEIKSDIVKGLVGQIPVTQLVERGDGTLLRRPGGYSIYHKTHAHYHHNGFGTLELLKVLDPAKGQLVAAGSGPKQGFCMLDFKIAQWKKFSNAPAGQTRQDCNVAGTPASTTQLGLGVGWGDIYVYHLDGNYVEFGDNGDGLYVVRSIADAYNQVLESDETDNAGYAYIKVTGNSVKVLERGRGMSPWDPAKTVVTDDSFRLNP